MWSLVLLAGMFRPVTVDEYLRPRSQPARVRDWVRGRVLASFIRVGMRGEEARRILGMPSCFGGTFPHHFSHYGTLGVTLLTDTDDRVLKVQLREMPCLLPAEQ